MAVSYPAKVLAAFERFWAVYPYRSINPRARALAVFARLVKEGDDPEVIIAATARFAEVVKAERLKTIFIPHARTWLHGRDFEDFPPADAPAPAEPAQPAPDHPMEFMRSHMTAAAWSAWIERLTVSGEPGAIVITAPLGIVRDRVSQDYGHIIRRHLGAVTWRIAGKTE